MTTKKLSSKKAFTLVELIIVIAIIAILAVTAFLLLTKRLAKARDASRSSDLANIENSLQISLTENSSLPKPDSHTLIYASGTSNVIGYQGYFGEGVKDAVGNINSAPKDGDDYFTYYLNADLNKYQIAGFMENEIAYNPNVVSAVDYSSRYVNVRGEKLGLLTDNNKSPLQSLGLTGLDILNTTSTYIAYMDTKTTLNGTGKSLISILTLNNKNIAKYDTGLVFYFDMESTINSGGLILMKDLSSYGNNGTCYNSGTAGSCGTVGPSLTEGKIGKSMQFKKDIGTYISSTGTSFSVSGSISFGGWIKSSDSSCTNSRLLRKEGSYSFDIYNGKLTPYFWDTSTYHGTGSTFNPCDGSWHFIFITQDTINIKIYGDGNLLGTFLNSSITFSGIIKQTTNTLDIGTQRNANLYMNGQIDEVRIYNRALSDDEVKALYNATK